MVPVVPECVVYTGRAHFARQTLLEPRIVGLQGKNRGSLCYLLSRRCQSKWRERGGITAGLVEEAVLEVQEGILYRETE